PPVRRVPVGFEVQAPPGERRLKLRIHVVHHRHDGTVVLQVAHIDFGLLAPAVADVEAKIAAVARKIAVHTLGRTGALAEYLLVGARIFADRVMVYTVSVGQPLGIVQIAPVRRDAHVFIAGARQTVHFFATVHIENSDGDLVFAAL